MTNLLFLKVQVNVEHKFEMKVKELFLKVFSGVGEEVPVVKSEMSNMLMSDVLYNLTLLILSTLTSMTSFCFSDICHQFWETSLTMGQKPLCQQFLI